MMPTPSHPCSNCGKWKLYPKRISFLHTCLVCHKPFCVACKAAFFLCQNCSTNLPAGTAQDISAAMERPRKTMDITIGTTAIGATILPATLLTLFLIALANNPYLLFLIVVQPAIGISMLISSAVMRYNSRMAMRQAAESTLHGLLGNTTPGGQYRGVPSQPQGRGQPTTAYYPTTRSMAPPGRSPSIPSSAFVLELNDVPAETMTPSSPEMGAPPNIPKSRFCGACGNGLPAIDDLKFCPACGQRRDE